MNLSTNFTDVNIIAGDNSSYKVRAIDAAGNSGPDSLPSVVAVPSPLQKIFNTEFDQGSTNWVPEL